MKESVFYIKPKMGSAQSATTIYNEFAATEDLKKLVLEQLMSHKFTVLTEIDAGLTSQESTSRQLFLDDQTFIKVEILISFASSAGEEDDFESIEFNFLVSSLMASFLKMFENRIPDKGSVIYPIRQDGVEDYTSMRVYFYVPVAFGVNIEESIRLAKENAAINILKNYRNLEEATVMEMTAQIGSNSFPSLDVYFVDKQSIGNVMSATSIIGDFRHGVYGPFMRKTNAILSSHQMIKRKNVNDKHRRRQALNNMLEYS